MISRRRLLASLSCPAWIRAAAPQPRPTKAIPLLAGNWADPTILKDGDDYYMTHSSFAYQPGLLIWRSKDLKSWRPISRAVVNQKGSIWAPELIHHAGRFYLYFYCAAPHWANFVITADRIEGPWSDPIKLDVGWIDPGHAAGPDGKRYLHVADGQCVEIDPTGTKVIRSEERRVGKECRSRWSPYH